MRALQSTLAQAFIVEMLARLTALGPDRFTEEWGLDACILLVSIVGVRWRSRPARMCACARALTHAHGPTLSFATLAHSLFLTDGVHNHNRIHVHVPLTPLKRRVSLAAAQATIPRVHVAFTALRLLRPLSLSRRLRALCGVLRQSADMVRCARTRTPTHAVTHICVCARSCVCARVCISQMCV